MFLIPLTLPPVRSGFGRATEVKVTCPRFRLATSCTLGESSREIYVAHPGLTSCCPAKNKKIKIVGDAVDVYETF